MAVLRDMIRQARAGRYTDENAEAKVCQDVVLKALSESSFSRNATIKGGVVMRSITGDARRATQDMDIDFIRYSLSDDSIRAFIQALNCLPDIRIVRTGRITELKQQDYHGKRVFVQISDDTGFTIESKIDLGVHKHLQIEQEEYCFDIGCFDDGACLLINTKEQMFAEKLRSLLKFGSNSTRYKDVFDMCYLSEYVSIPKLTVCLREFIFDDPGMREHNMGDILNRLDRTFASESYVKGLADSRHNWLGSDVHDVISSLRSFLEKL